MALGMGLLKGPTGGCFLMSEVPLKTLLRLENRAAQTPTIIPTPCTLNPTGLPHSKETAPPKAPTEGLCLGS